MYVQDFKHDKLLSNIDSKIQLLILNYYLYLKHCMITDKKLYKNTLS